MFCGGANKPTLIIHQNGFCETCSILGNTVYYLFLVNCSKKGTNVSLLSTVEGK